MQNILINELKYDPKNLSFSIDLRMLPRYNKLVNDIAKGRDIQVVGRTRTCTFYHDHTKMSIIGEYDVTYRISPNQLDKSYIIDIKIKFR